MVEDGRSKEKQEEIYLHFHYLHFIIFIVFLAPVTISSKQIVVLKLFMKCYRHVTMFSQIA